MSYPYIVQGSELESFNTYTREGPPVGTKMVAEDGRFYRFAQSAAVSVLGSLYQAAVWDLAKYGDQALGSAAVGATKLTGVGATTTNMNASKLKYGYVWIDSAAYAGPAMRVKDNTLITQGAVTGTITMFNPVQFAITTATHQIAYGMNPWRDVVVDPSPLTAMAAGVCVKIIAAASYGWLQTGGACRVLVEGTILEGDIVVSSATNNGRVMPSAAFADDGPVIGTVYCDQATTEFALIHLTLD